MKRWSELKFWKSGECQVALENLKFDKQDGYSLCPERKDLFKALRLIKPSDVKVVMVGQDPYPNPKYATGMAFSIPADITPMPPTLQSILKEYSDDLSLPLPRDGDLRAWVHRGVLLWNALPSCRAWHSLSHDWPEWHVLTEELLSSLAKEYPDVIFVFLGGVARRFTGCVEILGRDMIAVSHPSPRASLASKTPFLGSRIFSRINSLRTVKGLEPIDWNLGTSNVSDLANKENRG